LTIVAAKVTETNDATEALNNVLKSLQDQWEKVDDKLAIGGLGFSALIVLWASTGLIGAIDKLPFIPSFFEFVGILFSGWFVYRYLLFKPDRC
jgi:selenocysteine lyase/cysteine desulfurase